MQVLRDSGQTVNLVVKRRVVLPATGATTTAAAAPTAATLQEQQQVQVQHDVKVTLSRSRKSKEDFGVVLGCKIYVKEVVRKSAADKEGTLKEGDTVNRINGQMTETMSLKEARKLLESSRDRLELVVRRERRKSKAASSNGSSTSSQQPPPPLTRPSEDAPTPPRPPPITNSVGDGIDDGERNTV